MRKLCFGAVVWSLLVGSVFAATIGNWVGPTGSFDDNSKWNGSNGPTTWTSTSTGDEVKICVEGGVCTLDSELTTTALYRYSVASGPTIGSTLNIVDGAVFDFGETRIGPQGATTYAVGYVNQTGGTVTFRDLYLGRGSNKTDSIPVPDIRGCYTISGGSAGYNSTYGRLYVGCGNNILADSGYITQGTFTVVGNDATILFRTLWVGGNTTTYGHGTVEFQVDPDGVSPITLDATYNLDVYTANPTLSEAHLVVSATGATTPQEDIVLVQINSSSIGVGVFDTFNGGSATEGTEVIIGDNMYKLTYAYAANDTVANDIALVHVVNLNDLAHDPDPEDGAIVETSLLSLSWTIPEPNMSSSVMTCDVYLGTTEPNMLAENYGLKTLVIKGATNNYVTIPSGTLINKTTYYWVVDVHDSSEPNVIEGLVWSFYTDNNFPPEVIAGPDQAVWLGKSGIADQEVVSLDGTTSDDGVYTVKWTQVDNGAPTVTISPDNVDDTTVTITEVGIYEFMLTATDNDNKQTSDTVVIFVGADACDASHISTGDPYDAGDQNQDCIVDLEDFAVLISSNWLDCTDTLTDCGI